MQTKIGFKFSSGLKILQLRQREFKMRFHHHVKMASLLIIIKEAWKVKCVSCHFLSVVIVSPNRLAFDLILQEHYLHTLVCTRLILWSLLWSTKLKKKDRVDLFLVGLGVCQRIFDAWNAACKFSPLFDSRGLFASHTSGCQVLINAIFNSGRNASSYHWQNLPSLSQTLVIFLELKWRSSAWQLIMPSEDASAAPTQR